MFWREKVRESREQNGGPSCGQIRVLVAGDSGVGKTSLVHLIVNGSATSRPSQTVGCAVDVRHITHGSGGSSSSSIRGDAERDFFVELWDISGHERYKDCRSLFYKQINGSRDLLRGHHKLLQRRIDPFQIRKRIEPPVEAPDIPPDLAPMMTSGLSDASSCKFSLGSSSVNPRGIDVFIAASKDA